jgi:hypothetical protein
VKQDGEEFSFQDIKKVQSYVNMRTEEWTTQNVLKQWGNAVYMIEFYESVKPTELAWFTEDCERNGFKVFKRMRDLVRYWAV